MGGINEMFRIPYISENNNIIYENYIMNINNKDIKIFKPKKNNPVGEDVVIYKISDLTNYDYMKFDLTPRQKMFANMFFKLPIKLSYICFQENFAIDESNNILYFALNNKKNGYVLNIIKPNIIDKNIIELQDKYKTIIDTLNSGEDVLIDGLCISSDKYRKCTEDSAQIEIFNYNEKLKSIYINLLTFDQKINSTYDENKKILKSTHFQRNYGFINKIFIIALSGFTLGIIISLLIIIFKKNLF